MFAAIKLYIFEGKVILLPFNIAVLPSLEFEGTYTKLNHKNTLNGYNLK